MGIFAENVAGQGNCGLLSIMALEQGLPQCLLDSAKRGLPRQKSLKLREDAGLTGDCLKGFRFFLLKKAISDTGSLHLFVPEH